MPKNDNNDNLDNAEATQTPAEYTPEDLTEEEEVPVTPISEARKRRLGTGAIVGISAAGVALIAGAFGSGIAVANVIGHHDGPQFSQNDQAAGLGQDQGLPGGQGGDGDGDGPHGHGGPHGGQGQAPQGAPGADSGTTTAPAPAPSTSTN